MIQNLINDFMQCGKVEAIMLGGSRSTGVYDEISDYDIYIYLSESMTESERKTIISKYTKYMEYSNSFWELEDDGVLKNGIDVEFIYRDIKSLKKSLDELTENHSISHGYSTCIMDNFLKSKILFDRKGEIAQLREYYSSKMSVDLYAKIVEKNTELLLDKMPSMYYQIEKAMKRNDQLSINHRTSAFFEIYFDVLFALNKTTHPGEKRMLEMALLLDKTPTCMKQNIDNYFECFLLDSYKALKILEELILNLNTLLDLEGYNYTFRSYK